MNSRLFSFVAGEIGPWRVATAKAIVGPGLEPTPCLEIQNTPYEQSREMPPAARWCLRGVTSNQRYATRPEQSLLVASQPPLGRPEATCAAFIPLTKSAAWWDLTQDERRDIFEARSTHIATGLNYLPAIARRLHHCRDLGEPFDFLTWFEYAPSAAAAFDDLISQLRQTEEWRYVTREVDIRLER